MALQLTRVVKSFRGDLVLECVSLTVQKGETLVLFGPSGAGKTVLLRLVAGVIEPDEGSIIVNGRDMENVEPEDRGIGMAFQNFALFPHMDARNNIAAPLVARRLGRSEIKANVDELARLLKIDHVLSHTPKELSNGQKQRTALARALAGDPSLLLLDDPLRNVDAKLRYEMRLELPRLLKHKEATVIYVTQDYKEAMALGDKIAVMNHQGIEQYGTPEDIYQRPVHIEVAKLFGDPMINLIDVTPVRGKNGIEINLLDRVVTLDTGYEHCVDRPCLLGVRPEVIEFAKSSKNSFPVEVVAETPLNEKAVYLTRAANGEEIMVSRPTGVEKILIGKVHIRFNMSQCLLFDRVDGNRIEPVRGDSSVREAVV